MPAGISNLKQGKTCRRVRLAVSANYQNESRPFGNTASGSSRAALTESLDTSIDVSREAVTTQTVPPTGARRDFRVSLFDAMKFAGPAPEKINGRLAMLGVFFGSIEEFKSATPILEQAQAAPVPLAVLAVVVSWASLIPIQKGARAEAFGVFSPRAEITNGRAAMLGLAILLALEYRVGVSFF